MAPGFFALLWLEAPQPDFKVIFQAGGSVAFASSATIFGSDRRFRAPVIAAVSGPTALAVRVAEAAGITLVAIVRGDGFEVFTAPERILG